MQNVVLPAYIYHRTGRASLVALLVFAQLGPLLVLSIPAGVFADRFDRRSWIISMQAMQLLFSGILAVLTLGTPSVWMLFCAALGVGIGDIFICHCRLAQCAHSYDCGRPNAGLATLYPGY